MSQPFPVSFPVIPRPAAAPSQRLPRRIAAERNRSLDPLDEARGEDIARIRFWNREIVLVNRDEWVHTVLVEEADAFRKGPLLTVNARPLLGEGLLSSDNDLNRIQRRIVAPAFAHKKVGEYARIVTRYAEREQAHWQDGAHLDVMPEMMNITLGVIGDILLGEDLLHGSQKFGDAVTTLMNFAIDEMRAPLRVVTGFPRALAALLYLNRALHGRVARQRSGGDKGRTDLFTLLLNGFGQQNPDNDSVAAKRVRDEAMTLFLAGFETVAMGLTWALYLLAIHPDIYARVRAEADAVLGDRADAPTFDDARRLPLALQVYKEALRLYPPVYIVARQASRPVRVGPYRLPRGTVVFVSPYVQHRNADAFPDPLRFDPDRWAAPDAEKRLPGRYSFMPFGGGPHVCVGAHLALMEGQFILALLARHVTLHLVPGQTITPEPLFTLRPRHGLMMRIERRQ